jgi:hypothetical protein
VLVNLIFTDEKMKLNGFIGYFLLCACIYTLLSFIKPTKHRQYRKTCKSGNYGEETVKVKMISSLQLKLEHKVHIMSYQTL